MAPGGTRAAGLEPPSVKGGRRWRDAGLRATREEGEVEEEVVVVVVAGEEELAFLFGWNEGKKEAEEERRQGAEEEEGMKEKEERMWEVVEVVEVVG